MIKPEPGYRPLRGIRIPGSFFRRAEPVHTSFHRHIRPKMIFDYSRYRSVGMR